MQTRNKVTVTISHKAFHCFSFCLFAWGKKTQSDEVATPILPSQIPMALALGQQQLAQAATLEHLKERLERGAGGAAADGPERKMMQLAEEQQRFMQQALQQNLLAFASHFNPMNLKLNNGHGAFSVMTEVGIFFFCFENAGLFYLFYFSPAENKQDLSLNITNNGAASINVSVEVNGTIYTGGS